MNLDKDDTHELKLLIGQQNKAKEEEYEEE